MPAPCLIALPGSVNMSLCRTGLCRGSAVLLSCGIGPIGAKCGIYTPSLITTRISLSLCRHHSSSKVPRGLGQRVLSKLQWANQKYELFLQRRFPRFYILYHTFMTGFRLLFQDAREVRMIKIKMVSHNVNFQDLPYREMEKLRQFRRDMIKAIPLVVISIPPFANYLVFALMYLFPRQLLIRHFWTPQQQAEFQKIYHGDRALRYASIMKGVVKVVPTITDRQLQSQLLDLCNKVQKGAHPRVSEIQGVRRLFSGLPLGMKRMDTDHMRLLCSLFFLTPRLPAFFISQRLNSHASELMQLDHALLKLGVAQLSDAELRQACYLRGANPSRLSMDECRDWLSQWLLLSTHLKEAETSLLLHSMMLLSTNYPRPFSS